MPTKNINYRDVFSNKHKLILLSLIVVSIPQFLFLSSLIGGKLTFIPIMYFFVFCFLVIGFIRSFFKKVTITKEGRIISRGDKLRYRRLYKQIPENIYMMSTRSTHRGFSTQPQFYFQISNIKKVYVIKNPQKTSGSEFFPELQLVNAPNAVCFEFERALEYRDHLGNVNNFLPPLSILNISVAQPEKLVQNIESLMNKSTI